MEVVEKFQKVRAKSIELCENLEIEDYGLQAVEEVSPVKWHLAHSSWFFETFLLKNHLQSYRIFHPTFSYMFNSYYNAEGERIPRCHRGLMSRPTVKEVMAYRAHVDENMLKLLDNNKNGKITDLLELGLNHEQQHQELLVTDLKYNLSLNPLKPGIMDLSEYPVMNEKNWVSISEGVYEIGHKGPGFCYDNERENHKVYLEGFQICSRLVSNQEFLTFVKEGGYRNSSFWHSDGWTWLQEKNIQFPLYWQKTKDEFQYYTLDGLKDLELNAPVAHISFYEAAAFAEWAGYRLPTEFEWEAASSVLDWGYRWEWTNSAYLPYPKFQKAPGAIGEYNGKFMINQMVLRGASVATPEDHSRYTYRNFFTPASRWQFTGIRLVKTEQ